MSTIKTGEVIYAHDQQALYNRFENAVISGCEVTPASAGGLAVDVDAGDIWTTDGGGEVSVSAQSDIALDSPDDEPRIDVVYLDSSGTAQTFTGSPEPFVSSTTVTASSAWTTYRGPSPDPSVPLIGVVLSLVLVLPDTTTITGNHLRNRRVGISGEFIGGEAGTLATDATINSRPVLRAADRGPDNALVLNASDYASAQAAINDGVGLVNEYRVEVVLDSGTFYDEDLLIPGHLVGRITDSQEGPFYHFTLQGGGSERDGSNPTEIGSLVVVGGTGVSPDIRSVHARRPHPNIDEDAAFAFVGTNGFRARNLTADSSATTVVIAYNSSGKCSSINAGNNFRAVMSKRTSTVNCVDIEGNTGWGVQVLSSAMGCLRDSPDLTASQGRIGSLNGGLAIEHAADGHTRVKGLDRFADGFGSDPVDVSATTPEYDGQIRFDDGTNALPRGYYLGDTTDDSWQQVGGAVVAAGTVTLSGGSGSVDTGVAVDTSAHYEVLVSPQSAGDVGASLEHNGSTYTVHIEEDSTANNPDVGYQLVQRG